MLKWLLLLLILLGFLFFGCTKRVPSGAPAGPTPTEAKPTYPAGVH